LEQAEIDPKAQPDAEDGAPSPAEEREKSIVLVAITTAQLIGIVRRIATGAGKSVVQRVRLPFQIASLACGEASTQGLKVPKRQLRN
jgi:hypothetical protein